MLRSQRAAQVKRSWSDERPEDLERRRTHGQHLEKHITWTRSLNHLSLSLTTDEAFWILLA